MKRERDGSSKTILLMYGQYSTSINFYEISNAPDFIKGNVFIFNNGNEWSKINNDGNEEQFIKLFIEEATKCVIIIDKDSSNEEDIVKESSDDEEESTEDSFADKSRIRRQFSFLFRDQKYNCTMVKNEKVADVFICCAI